MVFLPEAVATCFMIDLTSRLILMADVACLSR